MGSPSDIDGLPSVGVSSGASSNGSGHVHEWYDDAFCSGGGTLVGTEHTQVACPVCGELMDVDSDGYLFKHRPRIPGNPHGA